MRRNTRISDLHSGRRKFGRRWPSTGSRIRQLGCGCCTSISREALPPHRRAVTLDIALPVSGQRPEAEAGGEDASWQLTIAKRVKAGAVWSGRLRDIVEDAVEDSGKLEHAKLSITVRCNYRASTKTQMRSTA